MLRKPDTAFQNGLLVFEPCTKLNMPGPSVVPAANAYPMAAPQVDSVEPLEEVNVRLVMSTQECRMSTGPSSSSSAAS